MPGVVRHCFIFRPYEGYVRWGEATQAKAWAWSLAIFLSRERSAARFFSLSGGLEHQIQGGGPNGEARHGLGIFLTLFAQQTNEIQ